MNNIALVSIFAFFLLFSIPACKSETPIPDSVSLIPPEDYGIPAKVYYYTYTNKTSKIIMIFYSPLEGTQNQVFLFDPIQRKVMFHSTQNNNETEHLAYEQYLYQHEYGRVKNIRAQYEKDLGSYFSVFNKRLYRRHPNRCGLPFDARFGYETPRGVQYFVFAVIAPTKYSSSSECENMAGQSSITVPIKFLTIDATWEITDNLAVLGLSNLPILVFTDSNFLMNSKGLNLIEYDKVEKIVKNDNIIHQWLPEKREPYALFISDKIMDLF